MQSVDIDSEREKYSLAYQHDNYRTPKHALHNRWDLLKGVPKGSYLDISCGRGEIVHLARRIGFDARGTEFTPALVDPERGIHYGHLPELEGIEPADYVSCYEILEHLPPQDVLPAIERLIDLARKRVWITTNDKMARTLGESGRYHNLHLSRLPLIWWWETLDHIGKAANALPLYNLWRPHTPQSRNWFFGFDLEQEYNPDWLTVPDTKEHLRAQGYKESAMYHFWYVSKHPMLPSSWLVPGRTALLRNLPESEKRYEVLLGGENAAVVYGCTEYLDIHKDKFHEAHQPITAQEAADILGLSKQELWDALR